MHLLYCDESNLDEKSGDFLIYAGIVVDAARAADLSRAIEKIRIEAKIPRSFKLKFSPKPDNLSNQEYIAIKGAIIKSAVDHEAKLLAYVVLHNVARDPDKARRAGINTVCYHFHCLLNRLGGAGLVLIDRFNDKGNLIDAHLSDKFSIGVTDMPFSKELRLDTIIGFHYSAIGQGHLPSLVDVAISSLRFALNAHTRNNVESLKSAPAILKMLAPLFYRENADAPVPEIGFSFSPKALKADSYRSKYQSLKEFMAAHGVHTAQDILAERMY